MTNFNQMQVISQFLQTLIEKIGRRTSIGFATILISKAIINLREKYNFFNFVLINENLYSKGYEAFTITEDINTVDCVDFYSSIKDLIKKTMENFENNIDDVFINDLRLALPDVFFNLDNLKKEKLDNAKQEIMLIDDRTDTIDKIKNSIKEKISDYNITEAFSGVECFDLLAGGYKPDLIILNIMISGYRGQQILNRLKNSDNWKDIPLIILSEKNDSFNHLSNQDSINKTSEVFNLQKTIDKVLKDNKKI